MYISVRSATISAYVRSSSFGPDGALFWLVIDVPKVTTVFGFGRS